MEALVSALPYAEIVLSILLIVGIVLGALRQMRRTELVPAVWFGTLSAAALSLLGGILLTTFGLSFEGAAEEIFEGITMILAAALLTWMIFWMSRTARTLKTSIEADVHRAAFTTGKRAVFFVAFIAIWSAATMAFRSPRRI